VFFITRREYNKIIDIKKNYQAYTRTRLEKKNLKIITYPSIRRTVKYIFISNNKNGTGKKTECFNGTELNDAKTTNENVFFS